MPIQFDETTKRILTRTLESCFPDSRVGPHDLDALAVAIYAHRDQFELEGPLGASVAALDLSRYSDQLDLLAAELPPLAGTQAAAAATTYRYYWVEAEHKRLIPEGYDPFVGQLAMARVTLPATQPKAVSTLIGHVRPDDHLIATVYEANDKYSGELGYELARVDLVTPPRSSGARFGAISVMLGYRDASDLPSCYILEAGTATGTPRVLYLGRTKRARINRYCGYKPSPFASPQHAYRASLSIRGDNPKLLSVTARQVKDGTSLPEYMQLTAKFREQRGRPRSIAPVFLIARAAAIVLSRQARGLTTTIEYEGTPS